MTHQKPLANIKTIKPGHDPTRRRERWSIGLSMYDFVVEYRQGIDNGNVDKLSRLPEESDQAKEPSVERALVGTVSAADSSSHIPASDLTTDQNQANEERKPASTRTLAVSAADSSSHVRSPEVVAQNNATVDSWLRELEIKRFQTEDPNYNLMLPMKVKGIRESLPKGSSPTLRCLWSQWSRLVVQNCILCWVGRRGGPKVHLASSCAKTIGNQDSHIPLL